MRDDIKVNDQAQALGDQLQARFETIMEPELGVDIYNLGFIYAVDVNDQGHCDVVITFSEMGCSCIADVPEQIVKELKTIDGIDSVKVEVVWAPSWQMTRISRVGRMMLGISVH
ncbi:metal-sulfur cluster assembly factor [Lacticaseibacillus jixiensis]|uniref:metal-sulfur cluster assembly factor n=1 Tax=Lacticaseibacillus jixiensis TaxID=3231926 RepID=UPI0036F42802